jgi:hypothetical protein
MRNDMSNDEFQMVDVDYYRCPDCGHAANIEIKIGKWSCPCGMTVIADVCNKETVKKKENMLKICSESFHHTGQCGGYWHVLLEGNIDDLLNDDMVMCLAIQSAQNNYFDPINGYIELSPLLENDVRYVKFYARLEPKTIDVKVLEYEHISDAWVIMKVQGSMKQIENYPAYAAMYAYAKEHGINIQGITSPLPGAVQHLGNELYELIYTVRLDLNAEMFLIDRVSKKATSPYKLWNKIKQILAS